MKNNNEAFILDDAVCVFVKENKEDLINEMKSIPADAFVQFFNVYKALEEDESSIVNKKEWTAFPLMILNETHPMLKQVMPKTIAFLEKMEIVSCYVSRFLPGMELPTHSDGDLYGEYSLRYHLCAQAPEGKSALIVNDVEMIYEEGEVFGFDNSNNHSAYNRGDKERIILLFDVMTDGRSVNELPEQISEVFRELGNKYMSAVQG